MSRLFGTDGVRGEANVNLQPELAYRLGRAATLYFGKRSEDKPKILIGRDTRISGEMFEAALTAGICSAGGHAVLAGIIPTPAVAHLIKKIDAVAGIVISASHTAVMVINFPTPLKMKLKISSAKSKRTTNLKNLPAQKLELLNIATTF